VAEAFIGGDMAIEVTLINQDITAGVTIHWHGVEVPNAEDGVAGVTQAAVRPGERHVYRFRVEQTGTFWYHSHQVPAEQVRRGLFGAFVVEEQEPAVASNLDLSVPIHTWDGAGGSITTFGSSDHLERRSVAPGTPVRLRLINTDNAAWVLGLAGTPFYVAAIDGNAVNAPTPLETRPFRIAAGGRYDLTFVMPPTPVRLGGRMDDGTEEAEQQLGVDGLLLSADGSGTLPELPVGPIFDPASYGAAAPTPFAADSHFDREYLLLLDWRLGALNDGGTGSLWTINGQLFPHTPTQQVREGELIKLTFINRGYADHPMHPHGHTMLVLSRNGRPVTGSPWWTDTLNVAPGEIYEVAIRADNPGIWMNHCHDQGHAALGMSMHLAYEGITTPFEAGRATGNQPE
jgi:FtsP/CotA-like multicopper oxidase with cupredoxin domain